jgi:hypothetical protein
MKMGEGGFGEVSGILDPPPPPEVVSGIGRGGVRNHLEVTSVPPNTTIPDPPPPLKFEKHRGSGIFYVHGLIFGMCEC